MKLFARSSILTGALCLITAGAAQAEHIGARLTGYQETPAVSTGASGEFRGFISRNEDSIDYELSFSGLEGTVTQSHIHIGQRSVAGGISIWLCQTATNPAPAGQVGIPTCPHTGVITGRVSAANVIGPSGQGVAAGEFAEVIAAIRAGAAYANVHSSKFTSGELRGQIRAANKHRD